MPIPSLITCDIYYSSISVYAAAKASIKSLVTKLHELGKKKEKPPVTSPKSAPNVQKKLSGQRMQVPGVELEKKNKNITEKYKELQYSGLDVSK